METRNIVDNLCITLGFFKLAHSDYFMLSSRPQGTLLN